MRERPDFVLPSQADIVDVLRRHRLIKLKESVKRAFVVGSFARGCPHLDSDVDVLLEVEPVEGVGAGELEAAYRRPLQQYFVTHDIRGKCDEVHPQWCGRRVDVYFTYDAAAEPRPKLELEARATLRRTRRP